MSYDPRSGRKPWYSNPRTNEGDQTLNLFLHAGVLWVGKVLDTLMISAIFRVKEEFEENTKDTAREPPSPVVFSGPLNHNENCLEVLWRLQ